MTFSALKIYILKLFHISSSNARQEGVLRERTLSKARSTTTRSSHFTVCRQTPDVWMALGLERFRKNCNTSALLCDQTRSCSADSELQRYKVEEPHSVAVYQTHGGWMRFAWWDARVSVCWPAHRVKMNDRQTKAFLTAIRRAILPAIAPTQAATF